MRERNSQVMAFLEAMVESFSPLAAGAGAETVGVGVEVVWGMTVAGAAPRVVGPGAAPRSSFNRSSHGAPRACVGRVVGSIDARADWSARPVGVCVTNAVAMSGIT